MIVLFLGGFLLKIMVLLKNKQNGIVERKNKHLLEVARVIMFYMNVSKYLWGETVLTASYLINMMPIRILKYITPLEFKKKNFPMS